MKLTKSLAATALCCFTATASGGTQSGQLQYHNQVIYKIFTLESPEKVSIWTDSHASGGFDSILSLWHGNGSLITLVDDAPLRPEMGPGDAGIFELLLGPGMYIVGLTPFSNFPNGALNKGYMYDGEVPVGLPNAGCNATCTGYRLHWTMGSTPPVPEPSTYAMLLAGLGVVAGSIARLRSGKG